MEILKGITISSTEAAAAIAASKEAEIFEAFAGPVEKGEISWSKMIDNKVAAAGNGAGPEDAN